MKLDVLTLFPEILQAHLGISIVGRARARGLADVRLVDIRDFTSDSHRTVDDKPYGGGPGMVLKPEPIFDAVEHVKQLNAETPYRIILMSPAGETYSQSRAKELAACEGIIIICGRYEGVDERVKTGLGAEEISIGDYVISGGELAAMVVIESIVRLLPGALGDENSAGADSFSSGLIKYPQYTRPAEYRGMKVPAVLLTGNHEEIRQWRRKEALRRTLERKPDVLSQACLSTEDKRFLKQVSGKSPG